MSTHAGQARRRVSGIVQETFNVTVLAGGSVQLLLVDNDPLKKALLDKGVQHPKHNEKLGLVTDAFMDFVRAAWTNCIDHLE